MLIPHINFPVRPKVSEGESLAGYLKRFYCSNGYPVPQEIKNALRSLYEGKGIQEALDLLQETIGEPNNSARGLWLGLRFDRSATRKWQNHEYGKVKFCPACLETTDCHFGIFELPIIHACPLHRCTLLTDCSTCGKSLTWAGMALGWYCQCGASIKAMPTISAPAWAINLSTILIGSEDLRIPKIFLECKTEFPQHSLTYTLHDIFDTLAWAHDLRKILARRNSYCPANWPIRTKRTTRTEPAAWETRLLSDLPSCLYLILIRIFEWNFRGEDRMLLISRGDGPLQHALRALDLMPASKHAFAAALHESANRLLAEYRAPIRGCTNVYFNPCLPNTDTQARLELLAEWWHVLSNRINLLAPEFALPGNSDQDNRYVYFNSDSTLQIASILNELIEAATVGLKIDGFWKLAHRWHVPVKLRRRMRPGEVLLKIAEYLTEITTAERAFFLALLVDARRIEMR